MLLKKSKFIEEHTSTLIEATEWSVKCYLTVILQVTRNSRWISDIYLFKANEKNMSANVLLVHAVLDN